MLSYQCYARSTLPKRLIQSDAACMPDKPMTRSTTSGLCRPCVYRQNAVYKWPIGCSLSEKTVQGEVESLVFTAGSLGSRPIPSMYKVLSVPSLENEQGVEEKSV